LLHAGFLLSIFFDPNDGAEMSADFQWTTQHYIPDKIPLS
jgi:hypothetical protein